VLSNGAAGNIDKSQLKELVITDTIDPSEQTKASKKVRTLSMAPMIGEAIRRIANDESISKMFD
jgi:ribose-phosphate pyrophosphokinase